MLWLLSAEIKGVHRDSLTEFFLFKLGYFYFICSDVLSVWGCWISWNCSCSQLWAAMWVLGTEQGSSGRAAKVLTQWIISGRSKHLRTLIKVGFERKPVYKSWWLMSLVSLLRKQRQVDPCEFKESLVCIRSSRIPRDLVFSNKK